MHGQTSGVSSPQQDMEKRSYQYIAKRILVSLQVFQASIVEIFTCGIAPLYSVRIKNVDIFHQHNFHARQISRSRPRRFERVRF